MSIKPMGSRVLVAMMPLDGLSSGGIILKDREHHVGRPREGIVRAVGKQKAGEFPLKVGYRVVVAKHGGVAIKEAGVVYHLYEREGILGVVMEGEA